MRAMVVFAAIDHEFARPDLAHLGERMPQASPDVTNPFSPASAKPHSPPNERPSPRARRARR